MIQSRRGFLSGLLAVVAAPAIIRTPGLLMPVKQMLELGPELELAGETALISNSMLTMQMITRDAVRLWTNSCEFIRRIDSQYDAGFARNEAKLGSPLLLRMPK